jgi:protein-S-isoprenylcysteine O-methyltransferase Ste14
MGLAVNPCARLVDVLFVQDHQLARDLLVGTVVAAVVTESWATYRAHSSSASTRLQNLVQSVRITMAPRNRGTASTVDHGTKRILLFGTIAGGAVAVILASRFPSVRWGSNSWFGVSLGLAIALAGIAVRVGAVSTLGRYFQREVVIEAGQTVVSSGPYRWGRHPAYAGNLLLVFGFGVAVGSWIGAAVGLAIALLAHLPRIRVEETALHTAFGDAYARYASTTFRVLPGVW